MAARSLALSGQPPAGAVAVDFDAFMAEQDGEEPVTIRVGRRDWDLPATLPASLPLRAMRLASRGREAQIPPAESAKMIRAVFGTDAEEILDAVPEHHLGELLRQVLDAYAARSPAKAPAPQQGPPRAKKKKANKRTPKGRSSGTSARSSPTSTGSTGSASTTPGSSTA